MSQTVVNTDSSLRYVDPKGLTPARERAALPFERRSEPRRFMQGSVTALCRPSTADASNRIGAWTQCGGSRNGGGPVRPGQAGH